MSLTQCSQPNNNLANHHSSVFNLLAFSLCSTSRLLFFELSIFSDNIFFLMLSMVTFLLPTSHEVLSFLTIEWFGSMTVSTLSLSEK